MVTNIVNTVTEDVLPMQDEKTSKYRERLNSFRTSMSVFRNMLNNGTLTEIDYEKICNVLADKYAISLCSIFRS